MKETNATRWHFTPGRVVMLSLWSFLLGSWVTNLAFHVQFGLPVPVVSVTSGIIVALGGIGLWLALSRCPPDYQLE